MSGPTFSVITGQAVRECLRGREDEIIALVEHAYRLHSTGDSVNPPSYFLRFPDRPKDRIIALPASLGGDVRTDGLKWISSFPDNTAAGLARASAVLILNDRTTGFPYACLEGSVISATRTAAFAALAAGRLCSDRPQPSRVGFVGTGLIARYVARFLTAAGWVFDVSGVYDLSAERAASFADDLGGATCHDSAEKLITDSDLVIFTTVAGEPHIADRNLFAHNPLVLHISLRDLAPEILLQSANFVDDVEHCLKADTSPHLTEQLTGNRDFLTGTLHDVITGDVAVPVDRPVIFSPFGLGVLDLAVGRFVHDQLAASGSLPIVEEFF